MILGRSRLWLAFDPGGVCAVRLVPSWRGSRVLAFGRSTLAPGALEPRAGGQVVLDAEAVAVAARAALAAVAGTGGGARLVAPEGLARLVLLERIPAGVLPTDYARFRLAQALPYPIADAVVGVLPLPGGRAVAAALRRDAVAGLEGVARALGLRPAAVHLESLLALAAVYAERPASVVAALLGDTTLTLAAFRQGALVALRQRLRAPGDAAAELAAEAARTATVGGLPPGTPLVLAGPGARALHHELSIEGSAARLLDVRASGAPEAAHELAWLKTAAA